MTKPLHIFISAMLTLCLSHLALSQPAIAQTASQESIAAAQQKYGIAQTLSKIAVKCRFAKDDLTTMGLNDVTIAVADLSAKDYGDILEANGQTAFVSTTDANIDTAMQTTICGRLPSDPAARQYVQSASYLINEVLYAISLSGVSECGDVTKHIAPVLGEAKRLAQGTAARADLASFEPMAKTRAAEIAEMCDGDNMFDGDYIFMAHDPLGKILIEMGKFMK